MNFSIVNLLFPEFALVALAAWVYVGGTFERIRFLWTTYAVGALLVAALALWLRRGAYVETGIAGPLLVDQLAWSFRWVAVGVGLLFVLASARSGSPELNCEFLGTLLLLIAGLMLVASAGELVLLFVALELISIPTYVLLFLGRKDRASAEATAKYFFLSILSSALFLYGLSFLYGIAGSTRLADVAAALSVDSTALGTGLGSLAMVLVVAGLGFRIAAVPFHFYAPDVYQGTTNVNAGLLAVVPKIAGMVVLVRLVGVAMPALAQFGWQLALALAVMTMIVGNTAALWQNNIRRLLAYSSIAHAGYMLIGLAAALAAADLETQTESRPSLVASYDGLSAVLFYVVVYSAATLGTFAALAYLGGRSGEVSGVDQLAGLGKTHPTAAGAIAVCMFSLAGIPLFAGFWGKLTLFASALAAAGAYADSPAAGWLIVLAVIGAINAVVAAAYYLRVVGVMYFRPSLTPPRAEGGPGPLVASLACVVLVVGLGIRPDLALSAAQKAGVSTRQSITPQLADNVAEVETKAISPDLVQSGQK